VAAFQAFLTGRVWGFGDTLVDGRELRLRRVSRPDPSEAEILTRLGLELPERVGTDTVRAPDVVQTSA